MGIADSSKVLVKVTEAEAFNVHSGNRDWVSMIECVSSLGSVLIVLDHFRNAESTP